jgi:glycosyltransferase involved in cell wall biosynthesis
MFFVIKACDLIHSCRGILILNKKPWVVDVEHGASFGFYKTINKSLVEKLLSSKYCKKIMPYSEAAKKSLSSAYDTSNFKEKIEVVYPAIPPLHIKKRKEKFNRVRLLFIATGTTFYRKGGKELLQAFDILNKKYDIQLTMKCKVPEKFEKKYKNMSNVIFTSEIVPREKVFENFYLKSDIFVMPTYVDSFGYSFLEAMSAELPVVGTDIFAIPEIIEDGKNGFLIHSNISEYDANYLYKPPAPRVDIGEIIAKRNFPEIVSQLVEKLSILIEDSSLRRKMGRYGRKLVEKGKFSIKERNKKLKQIYEEAIKK